MFICAGLMFIPAIVVTYKMASNVRAILFKSIFNFHEAENIRRLLRAALDHMSSGMIMINDDFQITLMNIKAAKMFGINDVSKVIDGRVTLSRLVSMAVQSELVSREEGRRLNRQINDMMGSNKPSHVLKIGDNYIQLSVNSLPRRSSGDFHSISGAVLICENVTERVESEKKSQYHANYDSLSDMPNRRHVTENIEHAVNKMKADEIVAVAVLDIDGFKSINDNHGHAMGDAAIRAVAQELKNFKHPNVLTGRLGGDEFILVFHSLKSTDRITEIFDSVFASLGKSYPITIEVKDARSKTNQNQTVSKSIDIRCSGGVIVRSKHDFKLEDALNKADIALRNAKQDRKHSWQLFDFEMESEHMRDERLRQDFRASLENGEINVVYQPMFTPDGKKIVACEALARWNHHKYGFISPAKFVPLAEQNGFINDLTRHILRQSCVDCAAWADESVSVSVNLSAIDLANRDIANDIAMALHEAKLAPNRLQVEVTESVFLTDREQAAHILEELRLMGVKTAIDDFGTGYSNLAYLRDLPLDKLKIDRTFVNNIDQDDKAVHFFNTLVNFTKALGYGVVVEGVETIEQLEVIKAAEVDLIQGYLFGKPMSVSDIQAKIAALTEKHSTPRTNKVLKFSGKLN
jgi:diguanylate cyclase (GGDEF)-like protein